MTEQRGIPATREAKDRMFEASPDNFVRLSQTQNRTGVVAHWWCLPGSPQPSSGLWKQASSNSSELGWHSLASPLPRYQRGFLTTLSVLSGQPSEGEHDF